MSSHKIQVQSGVSIPEFLRHFGTEEQLGLLRGGPASLLPRLDPLLRLRLAVPVALRAVARLHDVAVMRQPV